jgi:electron transport complex protein RnfG
MTPDLATIWRPILKAAGLLLAFAFIGTLLVGLSYDNTTEQIRQNERIALLTQLNAITPQHDNDLLQNPLIIQAPQQLGSEQTTVYRARLGQEPVAAIFSPVIAQGYSGAISLIIAVQTDGTLAGVRVISHRETPGLGDKIEHERHPWILGFTGKHLNNPRRWRVKRDGGDFDQFTGATITPRAVVAAVHRTLQYFAQHQNQLLPR